MKKNRRKYNPLILGTLSVGLFAAPITLQAIQTNNSTIQNNDKSSKKVPNDAQSNQDQYGNKIIPLDLISSWKEKVKNTANFVGFDYGGKVKDNEALDLDLIHSIQLSYGRTANATRDPVDGMWINDYHELSDLSNGNIFVIKMESISGYIFEYNAPPPNMHINIFGLTPKRTNPNMIPQYEIYNFNVRLMDSIVLGGPLGGGWIENNYMLNAEINGVTLRYSLVRIGMWGQGIVGEYTSDYKTLVLTDGLSIQVEYLLNEGIGLEDHTYPPQQNYFSSKGLFYDIYLPVRQFKLLS